MNTDLGELLNSIEDEIRGGASMLVFAQIAIALRVLEDRLWEISPGQAQRCNTLQHKIFG